VDDGTNCRREALILLGAQLCAHCGKQGSFLSAVVLSEGTSTYASPVAMTTERGDVRGELKRLCEPCRERQNNANVMYAAEHQLNVEWNGFDVEAGSDEP